MRSPSLKLPDDSLGKVIKIGGLDRSFPLPPFTRRATLLRSKPKRRGQGALDYAPFANLDSVVATGNFDQQHGKGRRWHRPARRIDRCHRHRFRKRSNPSNMSNS